MSQISNEIINLHFGQAGVQMGSAIWELLSSEHGIDPDGGYDKQASNVDLERSQQSFFKSPETNSKLTPRAILADLEPNVIDEIKSGIYRDLFDASDMQNSFHGASNNFARGFYSNQENIRERVEDRIRANLEMCDHCRAIMIHRSLGGGTGTGFSNALLEFLSNYPKLTRMDFSVCPSSRLTTSVLEPYNAILDIHFSMEDIDLSFMYDNESLYRICLDLIEIKKPNYNNLNRIIAQVISSITASSRYPSVLTNGITVMSTNLIPYPRIHYPLVAYSPLENIRKTEFEELTVFEITRNLFLPESQMVACDSNEGKYFSCSFIYRGDICMPEIYKSLAIVKQKKNIQFVDWCPTGFKVGVTHEPSVQVKGSNIAPTSKQVIMIANTSSITQVMERVLKKFFYLYSKRSFVHWFVGEGMEECEFMEAFYNISSLICDYEEICSETPSELSNIKKLNENSLTKQENLNNDQQLNEQDSTENIVDSCNRLHKNCFSNSGEKGFWNTSEEQPSIDDISPSPINDTTESEVLH